MPLGTRFFQVVESASDTALTATTQGKFCHQNGQAQEEQEAEVREHKGRSTVLASNVRETPHVAQANGATGGNEDKSES